MHQERSEYNCLPFTLHFKQVGPKRNYIQSESEEDGHEHIKKLRLHMLVPWGGFIGRKHLTPLHFRIFLYSPLRNESSPSQSFRKGAQMGFIQYLNIPIHAQRYYDTLPGTRHSKRIQTHQQLSFQKKSMFAHQFKKRCQKVQTILAKSSKNRRQKVQRTLSNSPQNVVKKFKKTLSKST